MQLAYVCIVTICTHTKQMQGARILYARVQFVHMCTLHVCCVERNICAAPILRLSIFVRDTLPNLVFALKKSCGAEICFTDMQNIVQYPNHHSPRFPSLRFPLVYIFFFPLPDQKQIAK